MLMTYQQQLNDLFERIFRLEKKGFPGEQEITPPVDCYETTDQFIVEIELPGFSPEDLKLGLIREVLIVEGIKREEEKKDSVNYICLERTFGRFFRTVEVPPMVDFSGAKAHFNRGVLQVAFPKLAEAGPIMKDIPIE